MDITPRKKSHSFSILNKAKNIFIDGIIPEKISETYSKDDLNNYMKLKNNKNIDNK